MLSSSTGFDVVTVPDFSTPARSAVFEARTLFFLASWLENAGPARALPLHLACIGEPPPSVRQMAQQCGARVHVCQPLSLAGSLTINKLRGLEVPGSFERVLMVDTDVFFLGDFLPLAEEIPTGLAAAPVGSKWVPEALWQRIYDDLGLPLPAERGPMLEVECGLRPRSQIVYEEFGRTTDLNRLPPHYNSGVILVPRACGLRDLWADHLVRIARIFTPELAGPEHRQAASADRFPLWRTVSKAAGQRWRRLVTPRVKYPRSVRACDQASLSTAVQQLRAGGVSFQRLPDAYHARRLHCQAGRLRLDDIKIFHATGFLRAGKGERWDLGRSMEEGIREWEESFRAAARAGCGKEQSGSDAARVGELIRGLYRDYVLPALAGTRYPVA